MKESFDKAILGYKAFREKYTLGDSSIMSHLSANGQQPKIMVVACCDSRVDPALLLQCEPGDLFVVRNVANIVPPYEKDEMHHGTSAALEFGICFLKIQHLILLGHSQCGGIGALVNDSRGKCNDFITNWVSIIKDTSNDELKDIDDYAKIALHKSFANCLTFPWIQEKFLAEELMIHLWFFDIKSGKIFHYLTEQEEYQPLGE